ncbi:MAG: xanthine dehydrogenase accessory protein XdhC [Alphaproteobacteria bacterium]
MTDGATREGWITVEITTALGSTPRDTGTRMWVSETEIEGTVGGGALEFRAIDRARLMLAQDETTAEMELPLGPALNQCCGGFVKLSLYAGKHLPPAPVLFPLVLYGGGHVGRALHQALTPLPFAVSWLDERSNTPADQASLVEEATGGVDGALHYVMTHDHQLDLAIVSALLHRSSREVPFIGMIGSKSKIARFRTQLSAAGFDASAQKRLITPIGIAGIKGKEPAVIAAAVAAEALLLRSRFSA